MSVASGLELTLLRLLKFRQKFERFFRHVPLKVLDARTALVLNCFKVYVEQHPDTDKIESESFFAWFRRAHPILKEEAAAVWAVQFKAMMEDVPEQIERGLMERLAAAEAAAEVTDLLMKWNQGDEVDLYQALRASVERYEGAVNRTVKLPVVNDCILDLLKEDKDDTGFHWRLDCLNKSLRPLRPGDFGIIAGRPDKGKTTFFASELSYMLAQVDKEFPGEGRSIVVFNNEGLGSRLKKRFYQSALDATITDLIDMAAKGTLESKYAAAVGRPDALKILDVHDWWSYEVEDAIKQLNPAIVLFDMVDNIKFGGEVGNNGQRTDQLLEAMYQWARVLGVKYGCAVLATSQISADGDGVPYPTLSMLKDSKTGKQGAADFIITLGASNDPILASSRFIGCTKNKLAREGGPRDPRCEVVFDGIRGRYRMPE